MSPLEVEMFQALDFTMLDFVVFCFPCNANIDNSMFFRLNSETYSSYELFIQISEVIGLPLTMSFLVLYPGFPLVQTKIIDFFASRGPLS
uniref:Uncharacterized protein n=1 Tax=Lactuca sativa TaxID=4236 RepID=A0A9R1UKJ8_LACSA|nr:hypothetical protein LSAT_V11C800406390 [Lactuca sativa]